MQSLLQPLAALGRGAAAKLAAALVLALLLAVALIGAIAALSGALFMAAREAWGTPYDWLAVGAVFAATALAAGLGLWALFVNRTPAKPVMLAQDASASHPDKAAPDLVDLAFRLGAEIGANKHGPALGAVAVAAALGLAALKKKDEPPPSQP